jgi:hypothetical protein
MINGLLAVRISDGLATTQSPKGSVSLPDRCVKKSDTLNPMGALHYTAPQL